VRASAGRAAAWLALLVGLAHAMVSAYWVTGGRWLLDTVGGTFERAGRSGGATVVLAIWAVVVVKVIAAVLPLLVNLHLGSPTTRRRVCRLAWLEAWILLGYGLAYTSVGLLVQAGVVRSVQANHRALAWHAYLWDPWFLVWGLLVITALRNSPPPPARSAATGPPRD